MNTLGGVEGFALHSQDFPMSIHAELYESETAGPFMPGVFNEDLSPARSAIATAVIGLPRGRFSDRSEPPEDPGFRALLETADLGPFEVTGLSPAVHALRAIVTDISLEAPDIYDRLGCHEMLGCRYVKGSDTVVSSHAWGIAIDLTIDGQSTTDGDDAVMEALVQIAPMFNRHGFFWGYAFGLQDALHFEASDELMRKWTNAGVFEGVSSVVLPRALNIGDRGPKVRALQAALNTVLSPVEITEDGLFGPETRMAVFAIQRKVGLPPTGAAPKPVLTALGLG